jgi:hypothetical protein
MPTRVASGDGKARTVSSIRAPIPCPSRAGSMESFQIIGTAGVFARDGETDADRDERRRASGRREGARP